MRLLSVSSGSWDGTRDGEQDSDALMGSSWQQEHQGEDAGFI